MAKSYLDPTGGKRPPTADIFQKYVMSKLVEQNIWPGGRLTDLSETKVITD